MKKIASENVWRRDYIFNIWCLSLLVELHNENKRSLSYVSYVVTGGEIWEFCAYDMRPFFHIFVYIYNTQKY